MTGDESSPPDESAAGPDDHAVLLSELDSHDLSLGLDLVAASTADVFEVDAAADPTGTFPQSVASGGPTPTARSSRPTASPSV